ncbi:MAG: acylphosphatase [Atopostipes suicloacalis]|nr:acylphosphatase [Atopostipes suicloacalis]MDN6730751.1 acylphosphatase [Atopostipes suicloacalis]
MSSIFDDFFNREKENRKAAEIEYLNEPKKNENPVKIIAKIYGHVQGVGFRFTTVQLAKEMNVNGIVKNKNDGSVYVEASADQKIMKDFIQELAKGPSPSAAVDKVTIEYDSTLPDYDGFTNPH